MIDHFDTQPSQCNTIIWSDKLYKLQAEMKERVEKEPAESDIAVQTKVINVNKTSKHDNQQNLFCWGTFVSDVGGIEKRSFVN